MSRYIWEKWRGRGGVEFKIEPRLYENDGTSRSNGHELIRFLDNLAEMNVRRSISFSTVYFNATAAA